MVSPEILDYVKKELARGISESKLRQVLMENGWPESEINDAFEKVKESKPEEVPKETTVIEQKPEIQEGKKEKKSFKEFLEGLGKEKPEKTKPEEKVEEVKEKPPITEDVKRIVLNKIFIIVAAVILLGSVAFFVLPSLFEDTGEVEGVSGDALDYAINECGRYCRSDLEGSFKTVPLDHPELKNQTCLELDFYICKGPDGKPKWQTEY